MRPYAQGTTVPTDRSIADIRKILRRFGAHEFGYQELPGKAIVGFCMQAMRFEMSVPLPDPHAPQFTRTATGKPRSREAAQADCEKETRRRWRSLGAVIKALLVAVNDEIMDLRQAFMPYLVLGNGRTIAENLLPKIDEAMKAGKLPSTMAPQKLLPQLAAEGAEQ